MLGIQSFKCPAAGMKACPDRFRLRNDRDLVAFNKEIAAADMRGGIGTKPDRQCGNMLRQCRDAGMLQVPVPQQRQAEPVAFGRRLIDLLGMRAGDVRNRPDQVAADPKLAKITGDGSGETQ